MSNVLVIASRYDHKCSISYEWALTLRERLLLRKHSCVVFDAEYTDAASAGVQAVIARSEYLVFFGHGTPDELTRLPPGKTHGSLPLISAATHAVLQGLSLYANCCYSTKNLASAYLNTFPTANYVGYHDEFHISTSDPKHVEEFRDVVLSAAERFINGADRAAVHAALRNSWSRLADDLRDPNGRLRHTRAAGNAGWLAEMNEQAVG